MFNTLDLVYRPTHYSEKPEIGTVAGHCTQLYSQEELEIGSPLAKLSSHPDRIGMAIVFDRLMTKSSPCLPGLVERAERTSKSRKKIMQK